MNSISEGFEARRERIAKREEFLKTILVFVNSAVLEHGMVIERDQGSCWTKVVRELRDFEGFTFIWRLGGWGSNNIKISFTKTEVFSMDYEGDSINNCNVGVFRTDIPWQETLVNVMAGANEVFAKRAAEQTQAQQDAEKARQKREESDKLRDREKKIGLL